jgi:high-affinity iron transporter
MAKNLFSVPIFFIVFRETLEAVIIIAVLLGLVEQLVNFTDDNSPSPTTLVTGSHEKADDGLDPTAKEEGAVPVLENQVDEPSTDRTAMNKRLLRKTRIQVSVDEAILLSLC